MTLEEQTKEKISELCDFSIENNVGVYVRIISPKDRFAFQAGNIPTEAIRALFFNDIIFENEQCKNILENFDGCQLDKMIRINDFIIKKIENLPKEFQAEFEVGDA